MIEAGPPTMLLPRYAEPHRSYHTLGHIEDCLAKLVDVSGLGADERRTLELAIWWHDAIYEPLRPDNEERSAELAQRDLAEAGEPPALVAEVGRLIRLTAGHEVRQGDRLGEILVSIDLSVLGGSPAAYDRYAEAIRAEYAQAPEPLYRAGRAAILRRFLQAPAIFPDPQLRERYEASARSNITRELAALEA